MTDEEKLKWFDLAIRFYIDEEVHLVMKSKENGEAKWGIVNRKSGQVLTSNLEWEDEPILKDRDQSFLIRSRFSLEQAIELFTQFKEFAV